MVGMDRNLSINEVNETGDNRPQYQTEEELLHSMGYKQVNSSIEDHQFRLQNAEIYAIYLNRK